MLKSFLKSAFRRANPGAGRSFLFCTAYFNDAARYRRWIDYYRPRMVRLGVSHLILIDDASPSVPDWPDIELIRADQALPPELPPGVYVFSFGEHLGRPSVACAPGWWRSFLYSWKIADTYGFSRIVHLESDCYVLTESAFRYVRDTQTGWNAAWCRAYAFPETAFQIIGADALPELKRFYEQGPAFYLQHERYAEHTLPFTRVEKELSGDRFGEERVRIHWGAMPALPDYIANATAEFVAPYLAAAAG